MSRGKIATSNLCDDTVQKVIRVMNSQCLSCLICFRDFTRVVTFITPRISTMGSDWTYAGLTVCEAHIDLQNTNELFQLSTECALMRTSFISWEPSILSHYSNMFLSDLHLCIQCNFIFNNVREQVGGKVVGNGRLINGA